MTILGALSICCTSCDQSDEISDTTEREGGLWTSYSPTETTFRLWSPEADSVRINIYESGHKNDLRSKHILTKDETGIWSIAIQGDLHGSYFAYQVRWNGQWLEETPGIYATAVGVNGMRAMVVDMNRTNPEGWMEDKGPEFESFNDLILYELHVRDITIHPSSGSSFPGKYAGLVEEGTTGPKGIATGLDHMTELGITHVHLLPSYDHYSIDETKLDSAQFNWGYDPQNYNVPEGSYSSDPYDAAVRIKEFKEMVQAFHNRGIGVILDVVYNHTGITEHSNFNLEYPGYYYRMRSDGSYSDASACGNETASEKSMMRRYMISSLIHWMKEYHIDGFRFDLMGIHDIETMNIIADTLRSINPKVILYGEGWTAGDSPLPENDRALKKHAHRMPGITVFSDDIRDGLKGSVFVDSETGFVSGAKNKEESVKFGIVGAIQHPQVDYVKVNYSDAPWANEPWQAISYVSCHDNHTIFDKLNVSRPDASLDDIIAMDKLSNAIVLTSQGIPFLHAGSELLRTKQNEHNSYNLPDSINQIDWNRKVLYQEVFGYYQNLIKLRKEYEAFRMNSARDIRERLIFERVEDGLVTYQLKSTTSESPRDLLIIYNARVTPVTIDLDGAWRYLVLGDQFFWNESTYVNDSFAAPELSMTVLVRK